MKEERLKILKMLAEGKVTAEEAAQLLETLDEMKPAAGTEPAKKGKTLRIRVYEGDLNEPKVNVNVPLPWVKGLAGFVLPKIEEKLKAKGYQVDINQMMETIASGQTEKIVDIKDGTEKVEIYVE